MKLKSGKKLKGRKKHVIALLVGIVVVMIMQRYIANFFERRALYDDVELGNFELKYTIYSGAHPEYAEIIIYPDGKYIYRIFVMDVLNKEEEGYCNKEEVKEFVQYAIRKNIARMPSNIKPENVYDAESSYFELRIGERVIKAGGYAANLVNKDFRAISNKFLEVWDQKLFD